MKDLPISVVFYKRTKVFDQDTVPAALLKEHQTKENTWGRIVVLTGKLLYIIPSTEEILELTPELQGVVEPQVLHHVKLVGDVTFHVDFLA